MPLTPSQIAFLRELLAPDDVADVLDALLRSGFVISEYLRLNPDLQEIKLDNDNALFHFVVNGCKENREIRLDLTSQATNIDPFPSFKSNQTKYIFMTLVGEYAQSRLDPWERHKEITSIIRQYPLTSPFFVIGDSHSHKYNFPLLGQKNKMLIPIHLLCTGGSALGLGRSQSKSNYGPQILQWSNQLDEKTGSNILIKFGQVDVEFSWIFRRIKENNKYFQMNHFDEFADESVNNYENFLKKWKDVLPSDYPINVCGIFPPVLSDTAWEEGYINAHIAFLEGDREIEELSAAIKDIEIPDFQTRMRMHASYNHKLEKMCHNQSIMFLDDFAEIMKHWDVFKSYVGKDHHLPDIGQTRCALSKLIRQAVVRTVSC